MVLLFSDLNDLFSHLNAMLVETPLGTTYVLSQSANPVGGRERQGKRHHTLMITITKFSGRAASAFVVPVIAAGALMGTMTPAVASTSPTTGICNGVTNQRRTAACAQPNLLKAAARQNAAQIATLTAERAALVTTANTLTAQIKAAEAEIAALDSELVTLQGQIDTTQMSLTKATADKATLDAAVKAANAELTTLQGQKTTLVTRSPRCRRS
jgi:hypothetical protein